MSLESNREDFEKALADMQVTLETLGNCLAEDLMGTFEAVVSEYGHYVSDIDELIRERDGMQEEKINEVRWR